MVCLGQFPALAPLTPASSTSSHRAPLELYNLVSDGPPRRGGARRKLQDDKSSETTQRRFWPSRPGTRVGGGAPSPRLRGRGLGPERGRWAAGRSQGAGGARRLRNERG